MSKELSTEWEEKIYQEAQQRPKGRSHGYGFGWSDGYEAGATQYASLLIEAQERIKSLESIVSEVAKYYVPDEPWAEVFMPVVKKAFEALSPVNPKKKEDASNL